MTVASNVKQCIATIKGIEAQLSTLALHSSIEESQAIFHEMMMLIDEVKHDLEQRKNELEFEEPQYKGS